MTLDPALLERLIWLALSLMLAFFAIAVQWVIERPASRYAERAAQWKTQPAISWSLHTLRLVYAVGFPSVIFLWRGALTERGLGLQPRPWNRWAADIGITVAVITGMWGLAKLSDLQVTRLAGLRVTPAHRAGVALRESIYHQAHWAFYREPPVLLFGPAYGAWLGLIPVLLEASLNPARWADLRTFARGRDMLFRAAQAISSVILYILTQNLWLLILADFTLGWLVGQSADVIEVQKVGEPGLEPGTSRM